MSALEGCLIGDLRVGALVRFLPHEAPKGPRAEAIELVEGS